MKLSISVMAHPSRAQFFPYIKRQLGEGVPFSIDDGCGITENCKRAWQLHDPEADYHVVIQDDAIICDHFKERATEILEKYSPEKLQLKKELAYNFYYGSRKKLVDEAATAEKQGYLISPVIRWGVAICLPTKKIPEMIKSFETKADPQDDERITKFVKEAGMRVLFTVPCLIDHRTCTSLVEYTPENDNRSIRIAYKWIGGEHQEPK